MSGRSAGRRAALVGGGSRTRGATAVNVTCLAPAKINLVLEVRGRRADGFHELHSVFAPLTLADRLSVRLADPAAPARRGADAAGERGTAGAPAADGRATARDDSGDRLVISGADDVPVAGNLVLRAAALLREHTRRALPPLAFRLVKRVPAAAGLGGGSSDALAALDLAAAAWGIRLASRRRLELAAALGSDVPFFALRGWADARGRGERLRRLPPPAGGPLGVLLVVPAPRLSTAAVFARFDADEVAGTDGARGRGPAARLAAMLRAGADGRAVAAIAPANDLAGAAVALLPDLARLRAELGALLGRPVHLSGSGPALAVLYPSPWAARSAAGIARGAAQDLGGACGPLAIIATSTAGGEA